MPLVAATVVPAQSRSLVIVLGRTRGSSSHGVDIRIDHNRPELVIDVGQFDLVLLNLMTNAIKDSDPAKAGRHVEIAMGLVLTPDVHTMCVRDNGLGDQGAVRATASLRLSCDRDAS